MKALLIIIGIIASLIVVIFNIHNIMELRIGYFKKDKTIYFRDYHSVKWFNYSSWELKDVDKKSFRKVTKRFAKDKDHVYYEGVLVEGCDPNSAELVKKHYGYIKDKKSRFL